MRNLLFLGLFALVSCGDVSTPEANQGNEKFDPQAVTGPTFTRIKTVCDSLLAKERVLNLHVQNQTIHYLESQTQIACNDAYSTVLGGAMRIINPSRDNYVFVYGMSERRAPIEEVETTYDGVMEQICSGLADLRSPMVVGSGDAMSFTALEGIKGCVSDDNHVCMQINRGPFNSTERTFIAEDRHWIRFRITGEKRGFYSYRKLLSTRGCPTGSQGHILVFR